MKLELGVWYWIEQCVAADGTVRTWINGVEVMP